MVEKLVEKSSNSSLRGIADPLITKVADGIENHAPWMTEDMITGGRVLVTLAGAKMATSDRFWVRTVGNIIQTAGLATDGVDGRRAADRAKNKMPEELRAEYIGSTIDAGADRFEEIWTALIRAKAARKRGDKRGMYAALAVAATTTLPSVAKGITESTSGTTVPETGGNPVDVFGTRLGRCVAIVVASQFHEKQALVDMAQAAANAKVAYQRYRAGRDEDNQSPKLTPKAMEAAGKRLPYLEGLAAVGVGAAVRGVLYERRRSRFKSK